MRLQAFCLPSDISASTYESDSARSALSLIFDYRKQKISQIKKIGSSQIQIDSVRNFLFNFYYLIPYGINFRVFDTVFEQAAFNLCFKAIVNIC